MKVPRDVNADELMKLLQKYGYSVLRQTGSHIRLSITTNTGEHAITVPNHKPIKIGTLHAIAKNVCNINKINIIDFLSQL